MISILKSVKALLKYRLNFYANTIHEKIIKFKHLAIIAIGLLVPSVGNLINLLKTPYAIVLSSSSHSVSLLLAAFITILLFHSFWIMGQCTAIKGGELRFYFKTFPFSDTAWQLSDLVMLFIANGILWIPFAAAILKSTSLDFLFYLKTSALFCCILAIQYKILHIHFRVSFCRLPLRLALLWRMEKQDFLIKIFLNLAIILFSHTLALHTQLGPLSTTVFTFSIIAYLSSGWFKMFDDQHKKYKLYFQQFTHYRIRFYISDLAFIFSFNLFFELLLLASLIRPSDLSLSMASILIVIQLPLILLLSILEPRYKNKAHIFAIFFSIAWAYFITRILSP